MCSYGACITQRHNQSVKNEIELERLTKGNIISKSPNHIIKTLNLFRKILSFEVFLYSGDKFEILKTANLGSAT